jgi:hypothetical protein
MASVTQAQDKPSDKATAPESTASKPSAAQQADAVRWNELMVGASKIKFYGSLRLDVIYDDSRPNNTQTIGYIRSEDPAAPASIGSPNNSSDLTIHPRLTRFGFDLDGPTVESLGSTKVTGKLEFDFYNNGLTGQSESRQAVRMRHAYAKLGWDSWSVLAGQTSDVISPIAPIVNNDLVMWGAGNLGDRRPQVRVENTSKAGDGKLILQGEIGLTGANDNADLDANGFRDGETSGLPTVQARIAYKTTNSSKQTFEAGLWGHIAWEELDTAIAGENKFVSNAYGIDLTIPIYENKLWVKGELWSGQDLDDVRGGIFQGINTTTGEEIGSKGGWVELGYKAQDHVTLYGGYSTDDPDNGDLSVGGRSANKIYYVAARLNYDPIEFGIEYLNWTTEYVGFKEGDDNRFGVFMAYKF